MHIFAILISLTIVASFTICLILELGFIDFHFPIISFFTKGLIRKISGTNKPSVRSPFHFVPTFLTALGILGTFTGIYTSLKKIDIQAINDVNILLDSAKGLLAGMQTAFGTSLLGLSTASVFILVLSMTDTRRRWQKNKLIASRSKNEGSNTLRIVDQLGNVAEKLEGLSTLNADDIGDAFARAAMPSFEEIRNDLNAQRKSIEDQRQEILSTLISRLRVDAIEPVLDRLNESAAMTKEASSAVKELKNELGGITVGLSGSIDTIQSFQRETLGELQDFAQSLKIILDAFRTETQGVMHQVAKDLQISLATQAQQQKSMLEEVQTSTKKMLTEQADMLTTIGEGASQMMNQAEEGLSGTLGNINTSLNDTQQFIQKQLEQFRVDYEHSLVQFFEQQNGLLEETLGQQREGLSAVVHDLQKVFRDDSKEMSQQIISSMKVIRETTQDVQNFAQITGLTSAERLGQIKEITHTLGSESQKINKAYESLIENFNQGLETWNIELTRYFEQANDSYKQGREEAESASAAVSRNLITVAEYLAATAENFRKSHYVEPNN